MEERKTESCGCEVRMAIVGGQDEGNLHMSILNVEYCTLHAKASEMYEALKKTFELAAPDDYMLNQLKARALIKEIDNG